MSSKRIENMLPRDLFVLEDESNPRGTKVDNILPSTILDQVYDQESPTKKNLRQIIEDLKQEIITGGRGNIIFPVDSVNGKTGDVILLPVDIGLGRVDNTRDADKPLSVPQRQAIFDILNDYDFNINMQELYDHLVDNNNPHHVTLDQINNGDDLTNFIKYYISLHNFSNDDSIHTDIRRNLMRLWMRVDDLDNGLEDRIGAVLAMIDKHIDDETAHANIMSLKEDIEHKVNSFSNTTNNDYIKYPSTRAVVEFVTSKLSSFKNDELPNVVDWIDDIKVINNEKELPKAGPKYHREAFFIRNGIDSYSEVAICRQNTDGTYSWDISSMGTISKFNTDHFIDTTNGLSIKMNSVVDAILDENGALDSSLSEILQDYYTKNQVDNMHLVNKINIITGTMDGTIRYYINDDMDTMSDDIKVAGLKRLAFLEWVTENELKDNSVRGNHILDKSIESRHIKNGSILPQSLSCRPGYLIGNTVNIETGLAHEVKLVELADVLRPLIGGWPDPNTPGGNPYFEAIQDMIVHPHRMIVGVEYDLGDKSYAQRFTGEISCIPNMDIRTVISNDISISNGYRLIDAGGTWQYQTDPEEWTILGGSNITGHTFATVTLVKDNLLFETISIGNRMNAPYDIWVKYTKLDELENVQPV